MCIRDSYIPVPIDDDGLCTDKLEPALRSGPKFMYVLPNFQNPGGTTLALSRRHEVVALSNRYGIPIVVDVPYWPLRFTSGPLPPLVTLEYNLQTIVSPNGHGYMEVNS